MVDDFPRKEQHYLEKIKILEDENKRLKHLAYVDYLTKTHNRNYFFDHYYDKQSFKVIMIDVNNLKCINDTLGHSAGDNLLIEVTANLKQFGDVIRYGGDEFILITSVDFDESLLESGKYCFGVCNKKEGMSLSQAIEQADKELYHNKKCIKTCD